MPGFMGGPSKECRRCSRCGISYPPSITTCQVCSEDTDFMAGEPIDPDWKELVELRSMSLASVTDASLRDWRYQRLSRLGFAGALLEVLADKVDVHLAEKLIRKGCPHDVAARILL